ncbi:diaminopimelate epimerase [Deltaproteobacteria bacterium PRO3]|nr:diaminopimelate epimerase [Deltaproteobacteria bacterium PRO3]
MKLPFTKMHGLGNDFIVVNCLEENCPDLAQYAAKLCDRRFGIGCDQMLVIRPSERADFKMDIYNNDGGQVEMCGNGIRCVAKYLVDHGATSKDELAIETLAGIIRPRLVGDLVEVDMGEPVLEGKDIPTTLEGKILNRPLAVDGHSFDITCVSMGNPHCVIFVDDVARAPVTTLGPLIERHPLFPKRTNVEFIQVLGPAELKMRVWERGAGETLACGTGACGALVAAVITGRAQREAVLHLKGGDLRIRWSEKNNRVYMTGPGEEVFTGSIELS